jgi:hypothetical protein
MTITTPERRELVGDDKKDDYETQTSNDGAWVGVRQGHHNDTNEDVTDIIVQDKETGDHAHIGINFDGDQVFRVDK